MATLIRSLSGNSSTVSVVEPVFATALTTTAERGYGKVDKQRIPLTDNEVIEQNLGKYG